MSDLISRQDVINAIENTDAEITAEEWDELTNAIIALPSADRPTVECYVDQPMVIRGVSDRYLMDKMDGVIVYSETGCKEFAEVVRCRDCKHYNPYEDQREYDCLTGMCGVMKDDYCSFAERKEE